MKVLMIAPRKGGIDVYVNRLSEELMNLGHTVKAVGISPDHRLYDCSSHTWKSSAEVKQLVRLFIQSLNLEEFDIVGLHFGKNDPEQYVPVVLQDLRIRTPPSVYFVHYLSRNLFTQYLDDAVTQYRVEESVKSFFDGYFFYGYFASEYMERVCNRKLKKTIAYYPEAHSRDQAPVSTAAKVLSYLRPQPDMPLVILPGYAANYKDHSLLLESFRTVGNRLNFVFAGKGWKKKIGFDERVINKVNVMVLDQEFCPAEFGLLCKLSLFGVFPYRQPDNAEEIFQGSGALPNFLHAGKACIVLDEGVMPEYVGESGIIIKNRCPIELGRAIESLLDGEFRRSLELKAQVLSHKFSLSAHAMACERFFSECLGLQ